MCQQQQCDMSSQIELLYQNGMPRKIGRVVERTLKKRVAAAAIEKQNNNNNNNNDSNNTTFGCDNDDICKNCEQCGGCLKPKNDFTNCCTCDGGVRTPLASNSDEEFEEEQSNLLVRTTKANTENGKFSTSSSASSSPSASDIESDESLVDSDSGFRTRSSRKSSTASRRTCPMAGLLSNARAIETSAESQSAPNRKSSVSVPSTHKHQLKDDILAVSTQLTKKVVRQINQFTFKVQKSKTYRVLSKSTQPAHVIAVGILSFVLLAVWPNLLENEEAALHSNERRSGWAQVAYLGAFATHFGAQIWMTFVSGLSLYFALPRHTFGLCQQILFPKYFAMNSMLSILTLILFIKVIAGHWEFSAYVQVIALTICAVIEVTVRLYLAPPLLRLMREKHKFEITVGSGQEVGQLEPGDLVKCPHYQGIHKAFRRIHMTVAMGNLTALVCTFLHLHYLASKISVG